MRSDIRIIIICLTSLILILPASGLNSTYQVSQNGSAYEVTAELAHTDRYEFFQTGMLGDRVPLQVTNVGLMQGNENASFTEGRGVITFPKGNYSVKYTTPLSGNQFQAQYEQPENVTVILPDRFKVDNPLLTSIQPTGAHVSAREDGETWITWNGTRYIDIRYYDADQEHLLFLFGQFWLIIAIVLLVPFFLSGRTSSLEDEDLKK